MRLSDFSVDRPVTITMIVMIIVVIGLLSLSRIGLDMMPDIDFPTVSVATLSPAASPAAVSVVGVLPPGELKVPQAVARMMTARGDRVARMMTSSRRSA